MTSVVILVGLAYSHYVLPSQTAPSTPIDRKALVTRHNVVLEGFNSELPLQVGNGEFAFGMDATGLQTFAPFNTMSHWGWHSDPPPAGHKESEYQKQILDTHGRPVSYPLPDPLHPEITAWLAGNPHRINLGRLGFIFRKADGSQASLADLHVLRQELDLWTGIVTSVFEIAGEIVRVKTACDPKADRVGVEVDSKLVTSRRLSVFLDIPHDNGAQFANYVGDFNNPDSFSFNTSPQRVDLTRELGSDSYHVGLKWEGKAIAEDRKPELPSSLQILKAEYGAEGHWIDVTSKAKASTHNGSLILRADNSLGPDPILGVVKRLRVQYRLGSDTKLAEAPENDVVRINLATGIHNLTITPRSESSHFSFVCSYSPKPISNHLPNAAAIISSSEAAWPAYWKNGGAIDLSASSDPRWNELERRVVLSQYLMKVNEAGSLPPQESGLLNNGWFGRFHMEMVWWHATHWALWNRWSELDKSLSIYHRLLPKAKQRAKGEGFDGARWPKCIGPDFREWPHEIHSLLIWQQPHPIFFAELDYRAHPTEATLKKWQPIVEATADFLASYAYLDPKRKEYILGPPLVIVSENTIGKITTNPTFELGYWRFGLRTALQWRKRMKLPPRTKWERVLHGLSPLPVEEGRYVTYEGIPNMWTKFNFEHPGLTGAFGLLPGDGVEKDTMRRTLDQVIKTWDFNHTWGWDFPMLAMCAARLGDPDQAIDFLMTSAPGFQFDVRGLATGGPVPYFPANGGLLYAIAMMAKGWEGAPMGIAPGFPKNGRWKVRCEGLSAAP